MQAARLRQAVLFLILGASAVSVVAIGDQALTRRACAVERGHAQASSDELAQLEATLPDVQAVSRAFKLAARIARPGVVHIRVSGGETTRIDEQERDRIKEHLKDMVPDEEIERWLRRAPPGAGSGIIFDREGYILTNNHVVGGREDITVVLHDDREVPAKLVGTDPKTDLAVLKIEATDLHPLKFGDSDALEVGDWVIAVGSPFGLQQTVTHGIVSAKGRTRVAGVAIEYQDFIQTDAAINPGNSGGPLLNLRGEVVGVNTAIATRGELFNVGVAFTIPSNLALKIADRLKTSGVVQRGWLGVSLVPLRQEDVEIFGLPDARGAMIDRVLQRSPAERAGLEVEDVIVAIDEVQVTGLDPLRQMIADLRPDQRARFTIFRDGRKRQVTVRLGLQPESMRAADVRAGTVSRESPRLGLQLRTLRPELIRQHDLPYKEGVHGVVVMEVNVEDKERPDVELYELVVSCNGKPVKSVGELNEILKDVPRDQRITLEVINPTGDRKLVPVKPRGRD